MGNNYYRVNKRIVSDAGDLPFERIGSGTEETWDRCGGTRLFGDIGG